MELPRLARRPRSGPAHPRAAAVLAVPLGLALLTSCVGSPGADSGPQAVPTPGDATNRAELAEVLPDALDDAESASWQLLSFDSSGLATLNTGRLSCDGSGSGAYAVDGDATKSTPEDGFVAGHDYQKDEELAPAEFQAAGSTATDDALYADEGGGSWAPDSAEVPTDYTEDAAAAQGANCSHITATVADSNDLRLVDAVEIDGAPVSHWKGTAYVDDLHDGTAGYARREYAKLTAMDLGGSAVDVELWVDDSNRPVAYYQHLPPDRTGLQDRWFALTLSDWDEADPVTAPAD